MKTNNDSKSLSQQRFGKFAQDYVTSEAHAKGSELDRLVELTDPKKEWNVLDVATGGGHTALKFAPFVKWVTATDITGKMLEVAEKFIKSKNVDNVVFRSADAEALPFGDGTFDLVTCRIAPHHFSDCQSFVQESARVLKKSRLLLVQDHVVPEDKLQNSYVNEFQKLRDPSHNKAFSQSEWVDLFQTAGFQILHTEQITKRHDFLPWVQRQECSQDVIQHLISMMEDAPADVYEWMQPIDLGTPEAKFTDHHIIIVGLKA